MPQLTVADVSQQRDPVGGPGRVHFGVDRIGAPALGAGDHQPDVGHAGGNGVERPDQSRVILARLDGADSQDISGEGGRTRLVAPIALVIAAFQRGNARMYGAHAGRVSTERTYDFIGDELRIGVHPGALTNGVPDQIGKGEGRAMAHLGVVKRHQVVDGHNPRRPPGGGHDKVAPVHNVDRAKEELERKVQSLPPGGTKGPGGHGSASKRHAGWQSRHEGVAHPPADRERGEVQPGPFLPGQGGQTAEKSVAEVAHAGAVTEERFGVDRDPKLGRVRQRVHQGRAVSHTPGA